MILIKYILIDKKGGVCRGDKTVSANLTYICKLCVSSFLGGFPSQFIAI